MFIISIDLVFLAYYGVGSSEDYIYIDLLSAPLTEIQTEAAETYTTECISKLLKIYR